MNNSNNTVVGVMDATSRGGGYVIVEGRDRDVRVARDYMNQALNGDTVMVQIDGSGNGKVLEVIERKTTKFSGVVELHIGYAFVRTDDKKMSSDFYVHASKLGGAKDGDKVIVEMLSWPKNAKPEGVVIEVLGKNGDNGAEMRSLLYKNGIARNFPDEVDDEVSNMDLSVVDGGTRRDMRNVPTVTIDPEDAKDFDDAISMRVDGPTMSIEWGVHIADVSHYVKQGTALDAEALKRGNSTYLVDRVIPMLPEILSNGACSLRPDEDKYAMSCIFRVSHDGQILGEPWIGKTLIRSDKRYTYEQAQEIIENSELGDPFNIRIMNSVAKTIRENRMRSGALGMESREVRFKLDEDGEPVSTVVKESKDAHKLVEEFMLVANKLVAKKLSSNTSVYRVHDTPEINKIDVLKTFMEKIGHPVKINDPSEVSPVMSEALEELKDSHHYDAVVAMTARTMAKAKYDTVNIGHYGLGFGHYTHFTSPIRRYADLLVHRLLNGDKIAGLQKMCEHISSTERRSMDAERESIKFFQVKYMSSRIGEVYEGTITGLTDFGIFVAADDGMCEGLIPIASLPGECYFDGDGFRVISSTGHEFTFGQRVIIKVKDVDIDRKQINYEYLDESKSD